MLQKIGAARRFLTLYLTVCAAVCFAAPASAAADAFALFKQLLAAPAATLNFRQTSYNQDGNPLEEISGLLSYRRPAKFRLQYDDNSYPLIISDGKTIWIYEEDLRQVITQPLGTTQQNGLIDVLASGDINTVNTDYTLSAGLGTDGVSWLNADALHNDSDIRHFRLGFAADGALREMHITDNFANTIRLTVNSIVYDVSDTGTSFSFSPPAGVEVIKSP